MSYRDYDFEDNQRKIKQERIDETAKKFQERIDNGELAVILAEIYHNFRKY